ncbi:MAG: hypothetical protein IPG39_14490 [Bacteroidetes bacterium]|nr:hypothetical protein [Bacteroidota bacterium]
MESSKIGDQPYSATTISQDNQWNNIAGVVLWDIQQLGTTYSANWFSKSKHPWTPQLINPAIINFLYAFKRYLSNCPARSSSRPTSTCFNCP